MLKPKRKTTKEVMKQDSFVETVFNIREFLKGNSQILTRITGVLVGLIVILILFSRAQENNFKEAELLLSKSNLFLDNGDVQNAKINLQELVDEYGSTEAGRAGGYKLAQIYMKDQLLDDAIPHLKVYSKKGKNSFLISSSNKSLSYIYSKKNELSNAIKYQQKAVNTSNSLNFKAENMIILAYLYLANKDSEKTKEIVKEIRDDFPKNPLISQKIDELLGQMMSK